MELTFLGTGTSTGVPAIACRCETCRSTDQRDKRLRTSAMLRVGDRRLLIDCGPDLRQQLLAHDIDRLDGCIITHSHYDHVGGADDLRPFCYPDGFNVYGTTETIDALKRQMPYGFASEHYPGAPVFHPHKIEPMKPFEVAGIEILPLPVNHYLMNIVGFKIGNLAYITDAKTIPDETIEAIKGIDTLVINALRHKEHISHMNLSQALDVIKVVKPRVAWLTHASHDLGKYIDITPTLPPGVNLAVDNLTIEIP